MVHIRNNNSKKTEGVLNYKVRFDDLRRSTFRGTNESGVILSYKYGTFTSDNVTLKEAVVNNKNLRVHLKRYNFKDFNSNIRNKCRTSSFGRSLKRKKSFYPEYVKPVKHLNKLNVNGLSINKNLSITKSPKELKQTPLSKNSSSEGNIKSKLEGELKIIKPSGVASVKKQIKSESDTSGTNKVLNRTVNKIDKNKIKIKLFPNKSNTTLKKSNENGVHKKSLGKLEPFHKEEMLFKKQNKKTQQTREAPYHQTYQAGDFKCQGKFNYKFHKLVTDVKHMKLPSPTWKIKVIIRQNKISAITFTNKLELERSVSFSSESDRYDIVIENKHVFLLGSPGRIDCPDDIEVLLSIVDNIETNDPMLLYK